LFEREITPVTVKIADTIVTFIAKVQGVAA
jgi:hypothetical protein